MKPAFHEEWTGEYGSREDFEIKRRLYLYDADDPDLRVIGHLDFTEFRGRLHIDYVDVRGPFRGRGFGKALHDEMLRLHPGMPVDWGWMTPDGVALKESIDRRERARRRSRLLAKRAAPWRNPGEDERLRDIERRAASGDEEAARELRAEGLRRGIVCPLTGERILFETDLWRATIRDKGDPDQDWSSGSLIPVGRNERSSQGWIRYWDGRFGWDHPESAPTYIRERLAKLLSRRRNPSGDEARRELERRAASGDRGATEEVLAARVEAGEIPADALRYVARLADRRPAEASSARAALRRLGETLTDEPEWRRDDDKALAARAMQMTFIPNVPLRGSPGRTFAPVQLEPEQDEAGAFTDRALEAFRGDDPEEEAWTAMRESAIGHDPLALRVLAYLAIHSPTEYEAVLQGWSPLAPFAKPPGPGPSLRWQDTEDRLVASIIGSQPV